MPQGILQTRFISAGQTCRPMGRFRMSEPPRMIKGVHAGTTTSNVFISILSSCFINPTFPAHPIVLSGLRGLKQEPECPWKTGKRIKREGARRMHTLILPL